MNFLFGFLGDEQRLPALEQAVKKAYGVKELAPFCEKPGHAGKYCKEGKVLGTATDGDVTLAYIGVILNGFPGWNAGSALDDPDRTAKHLIERYRQLGLEFLDGVPGSYALVLDDKKSSKTLLATDPSNGHSLFVKRDENKLTYGSKLGVMPLICEGVTLDRSLEDFLLGYQFLPDSRTVYKDVYALAPGTLLEWKDGEINERRISPWTNESGIDLSDASVEDATALLHDSFMQAVCDVSPTSQRVAVLLGGFDSALVASALRKLGKEVDTYSFHFAEERFNQPLAEELGDFAGTTHHWVNITPDVISAELSRYERVFNQTSVHPHYVIQSLRVCDEIQRSGINHALSGDGCDGLFLGYPTIYKRTRIVDALSNLPSPLLAPVKAVSRNRWLELHAGHPYRMVRNVLDILARDDVARHHFATRALDEFSLSQVRKEVPLQDRDVEAILADLAQAVEHLSPVRRAYHSKALAGSNKNKMEGCMDATGVTVTSPFAHPRFGQIASTIPERLLRPTGKDGRQGKFILMHMAERFDLLPWNIIDQKKRSPAESPIDKWYSGPLRETADKTLNALPFKYDRTYIDALFKPKLAQDVYRKLVSAHAPVSHALTSLLTYAAYARAVRASAQ